MPDLTGIAKIFSLGLRIIPRADVGESTQGKTLKKQS
jgi:hypothetical protein